MKKFKLGIIGFGGFGKFLHHWWSKLENVEVMAIADSKIDIDYLGDGRVYRHWEELVADEAVEIVSIVTPPSVHAEIACAAMEAGKHVLLEKPVAITLEQVNRLIQTQRKTGKVIMVNHMLRYNPIIDRLIQMSATESLGSLRHAEVTNYAQDASLPRDHWFWNRDFSGGIFVEHGVHFIDIINALTQQKFTKVLGAYHDRNEQQRDQVSATVLYDQGLIAHHYHAFSGPGFFEQTSIRLRYDLAQIEIHGWMPLDGKIRVLVNPEILTQLEQLPGWQIISREDINKITDHSRPTGWGKSGLSTESAVSFSGKNYQVSEMITAAFKLAGAKSDVYGQCVQDILTDLIRTIEDPNYKVKVNIYQAIESLEIALLASEMRR